MGGGRVPALVEFNATGETIWEARFAANLSGYAYRAFRGDWAGTPVAWDLVVVLETTPASANSGAGEGRVYVSWNGATEVEAWHVYVNGELR